MTIRMFRPTLVIIVTCFAFVAIAKGQAIWYVDAANSPGPGSGTQADPFCKIQSAINAASANATPPDEIIVAAGIYTGTGNKNLDFGGKTIKLRSANGAANCIIDCQGNGRGFYFHSGETAAVVVDGFTVRNGYVTSSSPGADRGGGVYCDNSSSPTLISCTISGNSSSAGGGIACFTSSSSTLVNCTINGNTARSNGGGGVYCYSSSNVKLTNCVISGNRAEASPGCGGGVYCGYSSPTLTNCTMSGNYAATPYGGGVFCYSSTSIPKFTNCILWGDTAPEFYVNSGTPVVTYCDVQGGATGTGNINADPGFAFTDDFHLMPGSPCIDTSSNDPPGGLPAQDAEGTPRPLDGNGDGLAVADIGAYEFNPTAPALALSPSMIEISTYLGGPNPEPRTLSIRNSSSGVLTWQIAAACSWVNAAPPTGSCQQEVDSTTLSFDTTGLATGDHTCLLTVSAPGATNSLREVALTLHIGSIRRVPSTYTTIQAAINAAVMADAIFVADGVYTGTGNKNLDFRGKAITVRSESGDPAACIIDCQNDGRGFYFHSGERAASVVMGLTIRNGYPTPYTPGGLIGGGVCCQSSSPTLRNCTISDNTVPVGSGGGVYCASASNPTLIDCTITRNLAAGLAQANAGAGVYCQSSSPTLNNCTISDNMAPVAFGGGVYCEFSNPTLNHCTISGNTAGSGGGVYGSSGSLTLTDTTISNNAASAGARSCYGGGLYCAGFSPTLTNCRISGNVVSGNSSSYGGGVYCSNANPTLTRCTISANKAPGGGGVYCAGASPTLTNCMITGNKTSGGGGGVQCYNYSNPTLTNCTISANTSSGGSGLYCIDYCRPRLTNCILWADTPQEIYTYYDQPIVTYCDVQGGYTGTGNINANPGFAFADDFHLISGSPCIDAGTNSPTAGLPPSDAEGSPRPQDGNGDGLAVTDMGAYEFNLTAPTIAVTPVQIVFSVPEGPAGQQQQTLSIRNAGGGTLHWMLDWDGSWLHADSTQGESNGEVDSVTLTTDAAHGTYQTLLAVADPQASNSPRTVEVFLYVTSTLLVPSTYATIQAAIDAAVPGDTILVSDGTYTGAGNKDLDFHGKAITVRSESGDPAACIIDCQGSGRGFYFHGGETAGSVVDGFTIRNGYITTSDSGSSYGAGICCVSSSSPTLTNCAVRGNTAGNGGGVSCRYFSSPTLTNCVISGNTVSYNAGGVFCSSYSCPTLTNCTISGNTASSEGGGVLCSSYSSPTLTNCNVSGNAAIGTSSHGGGVYCGDRSTPTLTNCILWADSPQEIYLYGGSTVVTYSDIQGGYAGTGNINLDPRFVNPAAGNFHLAADSPCIDAGSNAAIPTGITTDIDGDPRILRGHPLHITVPRPGQPLPPPPPPPTVDMGADEFRLVIPEVEAIPIAPPSPAPPPGLRRR